uniref:Uncharacterized protein n=1 Tax=Salarias fasciatus TaxID=181472 RepID=A0A672FF64_SALFA
MNRTVLLSLLTRCRKVLEDSGFNTSGQQTHTGAASVSNASQAANVSASREASDSSYLYIVFVMLFYSTLAMMLFKCFISSDEEEKDSCEEFLSPGQPSTQTFNQGHMAEKLHFEEENSL